jgi:hypothetical protein
MMPARDHITINYCIMLYYITLYTMILYDARLRRLATLHTASSP